MSYFASRFYSTQILNTFRNVTALGQTQLFAGLFITDPTDTGVDGIEIAYTGYQRQPIAFTPPEDFNGHLSIRNTLDITWPLSEQSPGTVRHIGIFNSQLAGNMLLRGDLTEPLEIRANQQPSILAGDIIYWGRGNFSLEFRRAYLNLLRGVSLPGFQTHIAMFDGNPESGGLELSGENYARAPVQFDEPQLVNDIMAITNDDVVTFPTPLETWGNWSHRAYMRGNDTVLMAAFDARPDPEVVHRGYIGRFAQGAIRIRHD